MKRIRIIPLLFLTFSCSIGFSETTNYQIELAGFKIGTLSATHVKSKNIDYYSIISDVSVDLLIKVKVYYKTVSIYKDDILIESKVNSLINGESYTSNTLWDGVRYKINCNTYKYNYIDSSRIEPIKWSVSKLYFKRPTGGTEVYAETYGKISTIKKEKDDRLRFEIPKSNQIYYYLEDGSLSDVEIINTIKNFKITKSTL